MNGLPDAGIDPGDQPGTLLQDEPEAAQPEGNRFIAGLIEWVGVLVVSVALALALRAFVVQSFSIPSESMEPTLQIGDHLLVEKLSTRFGEVERGEIVVFVRPADVPGDTEDLVKRVIAVGGESVQGIDSQIFIDGEPIDEPYLAEAFFLDFGPVLVPEGEIFMMGDNRNQSLDSRVFGPISTDTVIGRAFVITWPFDRAGGI